MTNTTQDNNKDTPSRIVGIQFSILSPDEIRKGSVAEITNRDTYIGNKPVIGGLFDPRMGVSDPGLICPTDGLDYINTPGYFGHIELARPVFYIQYLATIIKVLRCVCVKCSKLLISKEKYKNCLNMSHEHRWAYVFGIASKIKRCGDATEDGCGCKQPTKIKKEGLASLIAEWDNIEGLSPEDAGKMTMKYTPEILLKLFRRISDDDVSFMGFSPKWSRPDWMICQVLAVPPPAVRPSIKHDAQQRSEDDISHIIVNIIKANKTLLEKIAQNAATNVVDDWWMVLQYYIATLIDNNIPGVASVAQRSGRPLKSMKMRLGGKVGRVRGNLMGKRVDFSARSVITPDANLSIRELGVPIKIAKNITKPIVVTGNNMQFLTKLIQNGPDIHPGAKILQKKNGENISLRYVDRASINLQPGDIVHRHMMDGDGVLFNRQPTLHRMSMMCHIAKIMHVGDTFRMNVGDTKPYNADFDGDEMNLHMPQDIESETELKMLAAVQYQIISPANNKSIIGIFQDSLLGSYRFTRSNISFTPRDAMNLLMKYNEIDAKMFTSIKDRISSFDILTQILPPLTLKYKTKLWNDTEDYNSSNNILEIVNGKYIRGNMEKGALGDGSKGIIQRICNDFGNIQAANFVDDLQNIVTEYMKTSAYSVGISDLIADKKTNETIIDIITNKKRDVKDIIDQTKIGVFENNTGKTNVDEFESQVNSILNEASAQAGKIGLKSLDKDNRFVIMVNAGSKGSELNISQMISCVGQQNVDGKRIPYGFNDRTLPHYSKFDDSPEARGFVESSFIAGLTPQELFFHAMGGRVGLIDTAVKTSQTGYIQRRLIKSMEDLKQEYDMTVRNNKGKIIQYAYGDDNIDPVRVEGQTVPFMKLTMEQIYSHYTIIMDTLSVQMLNAIYTKSALAKMKKEALKTAEKNKSSIDYIIQAKEDIMENVFQYKDENRINIPVAFAYIINNIQGQCLITQNSLTDLTPMEAYDMIEDTMVQLDSLHYCKPTRLFKAMYYYYLSPKDLIHVKRYNKNALKLLLETIVLSYKKSIMAPGEMVGMIAAQSIGEPTTQMTLNTFHFAGVSSKSTVTRGVQRIEEILSLSENPKNPSLTIYLKKEDEHDNEKANMLMHTIEHTNIQDIVASIEICFDPDDGNTLITQDVDTMTQYQEFTALMEECGATQSDVKEKSKWVIRMELNSEAMLEKNITMEDVNYAIKNSYGDEVACVFTDYNSDKLVFRIRLNNIIQNKKKAQVNSLDQSDEIYILKNFQDQLLQHTVLRGIKNIDKVILRKTQDNMVFENGEYIRKDAWVLDTVGTNMLDILALDYIDTKKTYSNDIVEIYKLLGIEAARQAIYNELTDVIEYDGTYINFHHLSLLCDRMTSSYKMISVFRHGINNDDIGPIAKASFEETPEMFLKAARHGELDTMTGISSNVMVGQEGKFGTNGFQLILDLNEMTKHEAMAPVQKTQEESNIDELFGVYEDPDDQCSTDALNIINNLSTIKNVALGDDDEYNPGI